MEKDAPVGSKLVYGSTRTTSKMDLNKLCDAIAAHSTASRGDVMLVLTLRPEVIPTTHVALGAACGDGCSAQLPLTQALAKLPVGQWTTLGVPLKCLGAAGADVTKLDRVLSLESDGQLQLSLSKVALGALNEAANVL